MQAMIAARAAVLLLPLKPEIKGNSNLKQIQKQIYLNIK